MRAIHNKMKLVSQLTLTLVTLSLLSGYITLNNIGCLEGNLAMSTITMQPLDNPGLHGNSTEGSF